jgi:hypothetical protein
MMAFGDRSYRARTDPDAPQAFGTCDYCGGFYNLVQLRPQYEYYGDAIEDTGYLACYRCISQPQAQLSTPILPEDPKPILNPRPEYYWTPADSAINPAVAQTIIGNLNNGFNQFVGPQGQVLTLPLPTELDPTLPLQTKAQVLASAQTGWGNPYPPSLTDYGGTISVSGVGQQIMPANTARQWLLIYSPAASFLAVAQNGPPTLGIPASYWSNPYTAAPTPAEVGTVNVGIGQGLLQNALKTPPANMWLGSVWIIGFIPKQPFFAWAYPS